MNSFLLASNLALTLCAAAHAQESGPTPIKAPIQSRKPLEDSLRLSIAALPDSRLEPSDPLLQVLVERIASAQPGSGDFLISLCAQEKSPLQRRAVDAFVASWDSMSADQISAYVRAAMVFDVAARARYPEGFNVYVGCSLQIRFGWGGLPRQGFKLKTRTVGLLDGEPWDKPYISEGWSGGTYALQTGPISHGEHAIVERTEFEFEHKGEHRDGQIESRPFRFSVVDADQPDDLEGVKGIQDEGLVKAFLRLSDIPEAPTPQNADGWKPHMGRQHGMVLPTWELIAPLPFALCFDVELHEADGRVTKSSRIIIASGQARYYCIDPYIPREFTQNRVPGRAELIPVHVVLQPSYISALSNPSIKRFYAGELEYDLHIKIDKVP